jgi:hypothetical protein
VTGYFFDFPEFRLKLLQLHRSAGIESEGVEGQISASSSPYTQMMGRSALWFRSPARQGRTSERSQKKNERHCLFEAVSKGTRPRCPGDDPLACPLSYVSELIHDREAS